jgi:hypothetical protein
MKVEIKTPCTVAWDQWTEGERVRFCDECKMNVHNLSAMSDKEVKELFANKNERVCVFMKQRPDGSVVTDNCPVALRAARNRIKTFVASFLLIAAWALGRSAIAQGLVGTPVDPRYGQGGAFSIEEPRPPFMTFVWTAVAFFMAFFVPLAKHKRSNTKVLVLEFLALAAFPVLVYFGSQLVLSVLGNFFAR